MFSYKDKREFLELPENKRPYHVARLYLRQDTTKSRIPYKVRLFSCVNYLRKQDKAILSMLYSYLSDNTHDGEMIYNLVGRAKLYDEKRRRESNKQVKQYEAFNASMLEE